MNTQKHQVSFRQLKIIAKSGDMPLLNSILMSEGLYVVGKRKDWTDSKTANSADVSQISTLMFEDGLAPTKKQSNIIDFLRDYAIIVGVAEGLDQMPGTDINPDIQALRNGDEENEEGMEGAEEEPEDGIADLPQ